MTRQRRLVVWIGVLALLLVPALAGASPYGDTESDTVQKPAPAEKGEKAKTDEAAKPAEGTEDKKDGEKKDGEKAEGEAKDGEKTDGEKAEGEQAEGAETGEQDKVGTFEDIWGPGFLIQGAEKLFVALAAGSDS
jgi:hypothetical protein